MLIVTRGKDYNIKTRELSYVNAGHNPPVMITKGKAILLDKGCTILGILEQIPSIEVGRLILEEEALIITYTDGLTDLKNEEEQYFDTDFLSEFALEFKDSLAAEFNNRLLNHIRQFKGKMTFPDDVSVLTCKIF